MDGRTLFYVKFQPRAQKASLLARDLETGRETNLFSLEKAFGAQGLNFALSPDGQQLALATLERWASPMRLVHHILTMPVQGGEPRELFRNEDLKQPALIDWTPEGDYLLFSNSHREGRPSAVWRIPAAGGQASELCRPQTMQFGVLWSSLDVHPDGRHIAFDCFEYRHEVWAMKDFLPAIPVSKEK
jgi:Tol biopolymer transport system component